MDNLLAAKELFVKYGGSHFQMAREEEYDRYRSFGVSKKQEMVWAEEQEKEYLTKLNRESDAFEIERLISGLEFYLSNYYLRTVVLQMFETVSLKDSLLDSFSKVLISERVLDLVANSHATADIVTAGCTLASRLLQSVMHNPTTVAPAYSKLSYLTNILTEDTIKLRAASDLERCGV
ncbi:MAG: hypothetical protein K0R39_3652 [Symbiobacteriaceae bacterium]|jgi:hypothetical protein|nr:hypothetical protein [Symbiobacteriaceae bacterium]